MSELFQVNDYVMYGSKGVCRIEGIGPLDFGKKGTNYYFLKLLGDKAGTIYAEVGSDKVKMRKVITRNEADEIIKQITVIEGLQIQNEKMREATYRQALESGDCLRWIELMKGLNKRQQLRDSEGKKQTDMDGRTYAKAEKLLLSELSIALGKSLTEVDAYIKERCGVMAS